MATYLKALESKIFPSQAEAVDWAKQKKADYKAAGQSIKHEIVPTDESRRRWKAVLYLKTD